ncbi:TPA: hypothetical protein JAX41_005028 [Enterobacter roggenkampii]|nr:hypothetical protein [Enterobacter roggenkampii]
MDESRKAFEQYSADMLDLPLEMISDARDGDRYRHSFDRASIMQPLNGWWVLWQASRAAIEIELPEAELVYSTATDTYGEDGCLMLPVETIVRVIRAAGIKAK